VGFEAYLPHSSIYPNWSDVLVRVGCSGGLRAGERGLFLIDPLPSGVHLHCVLGLPGVQLWGDFKRDRVLIRDGPLGVRSFI